MLVYMCMLWEVVLYSVCIYVYVMGSGVMQCVVYMCMLWEVVLCSVCGMCMLYEVVLCSV